jgi:CHAT domain-containing protein
LLPNVHTAAENGLRQAVSAPRGSELFLSVCGLMSTGARTVLISRWRTGGASSEELVHQFAQELPYTSAADAWQRGVQMQWETPLDLDREPRVKRSPGSDAPTARHPLFWSGYMLIDTGWSPSKPEQLAAAKN